MYAAHFYNYCYDIACVITLHKNSRTSRSVIIRVPISTCRVTVLNRGRM